MSQFSHTRKATITGDAEDDEDADNSDLEDFGADGDGTEDEDEDDEIDPAVAASDMEMINAVVNDIAIEGRLSPLTHEEARLGQYSVAKVRAGRLRQ